MPTRTQRTDSRPGAAERVRASSGNVFADLGLASADERLAKAELAHDICSTIKAAKLTQAQAARKLGVDQPKVSALMRGRLKDFSIDRLIRFANRLGRDVLIHLRSPEKRRDPSIRVLAEA